VKPALASFALALALFLPLAHPKAADRIVSLNLCTDQLLVLLAPERIAALSQLAADPALSYVAAEARQFPQVRASAEAVLALRPDLVLAARYGAQTTIALLERRGVRIARLDLPRDFPGIERLTRTAAAAIGTPERAEPLIARMRQTLAAGPHPTHLMTAIAWEPRGGTAGPDSLMGAVIQAAGFINAATGKSISTEAILRHPPDLLILPDAPSFPSLATDMLRTPVLRAIPRRNLPPALTLCAGPYTADAVAALAR
jgi:iron complex transport system substrate-binding protein